MLTCHTRWIVTKVVVFFSLLLFFFWFLHHTHIHSCTQWLRAIHPHQGIFTAFLFSIAKVRQSVIYKKQQCELRLYTCHFHPDEVHAMWKCLIFINGTTGREKEETISQLSLLNLCLKKKFPGFLFKYPSYHLFCILVVDLRQLMLAHSTIQNRLGWFCFPAQCDSFGSGKCNFNHWGL